MIDKKLVSLAVAIVIGAALIAAPTQARFGGGGWHGGGGGGWHGGFVRGPAFVGRSAFVHHGFYPGHRFAFFRRHRFVGPFFGVGTIYDGGYSCWTWVPTAYGWQHVWTCGSPYGYGYGYY
jgi:hypothetical protein